RGVYGWCTPSTFNNGGSPMRIGVAAARTIRGTRRPMATSWLSWRVRRVRTLRLSWLVSSCRTRWSAAAVRRFPPVDRGVTTRRRERNRRHQFCPHMHTVVFICRRRIHVQHRDDSLLPCQHPPSDRSSGGTSDRETVSPSTENELRCDDH